MGTATNLTAIGRQVNRTNVSGYRSAQRLGKQERGQALVSGSLWKPRAMPTQRQGAIAGEVALSSPLTFDELFCKSKNESSWALCG